MPADSPACCIVWFRDDLRLADHPALNEAVSRFPAVVPLFLLEAGEDRLWRPGAAARWWLHHSVVALQQALRAVGGSLVVRSGSPLAVLPALVEETGATAVFWNRRYDPAGIRVDTEVKAALKGRGVDARSYPGNLLHEPWAVENQSGGPYQVFTPFWKACLARGEPEPPLEAPRRIPTPDRLPSSEPLDALGLLPGVDWAGGLREHWRPGEQGARDALQAFVAAGMTEYPQRRDLPAVHGTSQLSPHLHAGEISPRSVWQACSSAMESVGDAGTVKGGRSYLRQLIWREFAYHLLFHFPHTPDAPLREEYAAFPWRSDADALRAWRRGRTGYPIVDAGMRQLWAIGWMHNRVRMIVASFLIKDLLIHWIEGARWFWDTLVDADLANNTLGWQWTAGCGADAAPYFRIFNPVLQGKRFDPSGDYVRRWVPELEQLPADSIHQPWTASTAALSRAGIRLGETYPRPMVDHAGARAKALQALQTMKGETQR